MKTIDSAFFLLFHLTFFLSLSLSPSPMGICCGLLSVSFNPLSFSLLPPPFTRLLLFPPLSLFYCISPTVSKHVNTRIASFLLRLWTCHANTGLFLSFSLPLSLPLSLSLSLGCGGSRNFFSCRLFFHPALPPSSPSLSRIKKNFLFKCINIDIYMRACVCVCVCVYVCGWNSGIFRQVSWVLRL